MKYIVSWFNLLSWVSLLSFTLTNFQGVLAEETQFASMQSGDDPQFCPAQLPSVIEEIINSPELERSRWGIEVQTEARKVLYSKNGHQFFTPASSAKLLTTAAVLSSLGADYRLTTPLFAVGNAPNLTSLRLKGQGDPTISTKSLKQIVHQLQALGVKQIEKLIIDDSYFDAPAINPTWEWLDVHSYFATAVNSTILNENAVTLTLLPQQLGKPVRFYWSDAVAGRQWQVINQGITGASDIPYDIDIDGDLGKPILQIRGELAVNEPPDIWDMAIVDPANYFLESLRLHLEQADITVIKGIIAKKAEQKESEKELLSISSPKIAEIIREINQESNNLYAEAIAKVLAQKLNADDAIEAINQSLGEIGIDSEEYVLVDASGLSRQNLVSPQTLVKTLDLMSKLDDSERKIYQQSLAVAGISGTLKNRFRNTSVQGNLWGKTGTLTGVGSLSGYLFTPNNFSLTFSITVNNSNLSSKEIRYQIDRIILVLSHMKQC